MEKTNEDFRAMKKFLLLPVIMLLAICCGCASLWENAENEPADISPTELMTKMRKVSDPQGACAAATSYVLRQQMIPDNADTQSEPYQVEVLFQRQPYFSKTTIYKNNEPTRTILFNGKKAWQIDPSTGQYQDITGTGLEMIKVLDKIGNPAYTYSDVFNDIKVYQMVSGTTEYYKLVCASDQFDNIKFTVFVNKHSFRTRKIILTLTGDQGTIQYTSYINEYSVRDGIMMPATITTETNGIKAQYRTLEFKLNVMIPAAEFELPIPWYLKENQPANTTAPDSKK
ncbi:MAG: hypothetical protein PHQ27_05310 [Victivallales bacterium]|nr:hypothetical protein [Victivallales bacterium]